MNGINKVLLKCRMHDYRSQTPHQRRTFAVPEGWPCNIVQPTFKRSIAIRLSMMPPPKKVGETPRRKVTKLMRSEVAKVDEPR